VPYFKCEACRTRLYSANVLADMLGESCPDCASPLAPVGELSEVLGFQLREHARLDLDDWVDDGPSIAEAASLPRPDNR
jgi:hypothetical protein